MSGRTRKRLIVAGVVVLVCGLVAFALTHRSRAELALSFRRYETNGAQVKAVVVVSNASLREVTLRIGADTSWMRRAFEKGEFIHLANGVLFISATNLDFKPFSPKYRSRNASPIPYDNNAQCPRFLEFLRRVSHEDDRELLQRIFGMWMLGYNRAQKILILDGEGGLGKTQLAMIMQLLVGQVNVTQLRTELLAGRFETYRYLGKTLLVGVDVNPDFLTNKGASVLKGLVGGDTFDAEQKSGTGSFPLQGEFNVITERQKSVVESLLSESASLQLFIKDRITLDPQKDLTTEEILEAYGAYCKERGWRPLSQRVVQVSLENLMLEHFGVAKRNDIYREGVHRGFKGVTLVNPNQAAGEKASPDSTP